MGDHVQIVDPFPIGKSVQVYSFLYLMLTKKISFWISWRYIPWYVDCYWICNAEEWRSGADQSGGEVHSTR